MTNTDTKNPDAERQNALDEMPFMQTKKADKICPWFHKHFYIIRAALAQSQMPTISDITMLKTAVENYDRNPYWNERTRPKEEWNSFDHILDFCRKYLAAAPKAKPPEQGQVEAIDGLDEELKNARYFRGDGFWEVGQKVMTAARRYSELARGKGGR